MSAELPGYQQVADAIGLTVERQLASGAPWCPPNDAVAVRRWVADRGPELGSNIRRVVRFGRLIHLADGKDYARFLYVRISALRAREFKAAFFAAAKSGLIPPNIVTVVETGVILHEVTASGTPAPFEINYAQMPRLAALLDVIHNALGFQPVRKLLEPIWQRAGRSATEVARELQATLGAWLNERLESQTHSRQAQRMWSFLSEKGQVAPASITNESILRFWSGVGSVPASETVDGFRLFTSSARAMLRYREALADAESQMQIERGLLGGGASADGTTWDMAVDAGIEPAGTYLSPLATLLSAPADKVKWLTQRELNRIQHVLDPHLASEEGDPDEDAENRRALMPGRPFDNAFSATLRRADVFGAAQASVVARVRKRVSGDDAIAQVCADMPGQAYTDLAQEYEEVCAQLRLEGMATLAILMEAGRAEATFLLRPLGGAKMVDALLAGVPRQVHEEKDDEATYLGVSGIGEALRTALADPSGFDEPVRAFLTEARAATRRVNRAGFRKEDRQAPANVDALAVGAPAAVAVMTELNRLIPALLTNALEGLAGDRQVFVDGFRRLYTEPSQS